MSFKQLSIIPSGGVDLSTCINLERPIASMMKQWPILSWWNIYSNFIVALQDVERVQEAQCGVLVKRFLALPYSYLTHIGYI